MELSVTKTSSGLPHVPARVKKCAPTTYNSVKQMWVTIDIPGCSFIVPVVFYKQAKPCLPFELLFSRLSILPTQRPIHMPSQTSRAAPPWKQALLVLWSLTSRCLAPSRRAHRRISHRRVHWLLHKRANLRQHHHHRLF